MNPVDGARRSGWCVRCLWLITLGALASCQSDGRKMAPGMFENVLSAMDSVLTGAPRAEDAPPESQTAIAATMTPQAPTSEDQTTVVPLSDAELEAESQHLGGEDLNFGSSDEGIRPPWNSPYEVFGDRYEVKKSSLGYVEVGIASWYGQKFQGRKTSNGEIFDMHLASAAHKSLPIPTMVRVTNLDNGRRLRFGSMTGARFMMTESSICPSRPRKPWVSRRRVRRLSWSRQSMRSTIPKRLRSKSLHRQKFICRRGPSNQKRAPETLKETLRRT